MIRVFTNSQEDWGSNEGVKILISQTLVNKSD